MRSADQLEKLYNDAVNLHKKGELSQAVSYYRQILDVVPNQFIIHFNLGIALSTIGDIDGAIHSFSNASALNPEHPVPYYDLGNQYLRKNDVDNALACYLKAIELKPDYPVAHNNLDVLVEGVDNPQFAIAVYSKLFSPLLRVEQMGAQRIRVETSSSCNLRCQHCPTGISYNNTERLIMKMETFELIVEQLKPFKIVHDAVLYLGGEPLMNKNLPEMCRRIKKETGVTRTLFNTNAMLLDEKVCKELATSGIDQISVSIDGRSPEENDRIRKGSAYGIIVKNVRMLEKHLPEVEIIIANTLIKKVGDPDIPEIPSFLVRDFPGFDISSNYMMKWPGLEIEKSSLKRLGLVAGRKKNFCKMPFTELSVRSNGDVVMCCYDILGQHVMGNIYTTDLLSIWTGDAYRSLRRNLLSQNEELIPRICRRCIHFTGYIPVDHSGSLLSDPSCEV